MSYHVMSYACNWAWCLRCPCMVYVYVCIIIKCLSHLSEKDPWKRQKWIVTGYTHTTKRIQCLPSTALLWTMPCTMHGHTNDTPWCYVIPCHAIPCHATHCQIVSQHITPCLDISHHVISCQIMPITSHHIMPCHFCHIKSCHITSHHIKPCYIMSLHVTTSHHIMPYTSYHILSCKWCHHIMSCNVTSCHVMLHNIMSCHVTSYHVMSHYVMSHYAMSYHVMSCSMHVYCIPTACLWHDLLVIAHWQALRWCGHIASI